MTDTATGPVPAHEQHPAPRRQEMVQLLDEHGVRHRHPEHDLDLTPEELLGLYRDMVLMRRFDSEAEALQRKGQLGLWAGSRGQEASQIGAGRAARRQDQLFPSYRDHGALLSRGVDPLHILSIFRGIDHGGWDPVEMGVHPYTLVIAAQMLPAVGYGMGVQRDGAVGTGDPDRDTAVIAFFGDGATSQGEAAEALNWAAVFNAPVVFFCQNNQWAISEPVSRQSPVPLHRGPKARDARGARRRQRRPRGPRRVCAAPSTGPVPAAAPPSWSRTRSGWARTPRRTTRRATASPPRSTPGARRTRSTGCART